MYAVRCVCGRHTAYPNALVCPFCKKVLVDKSDEYIMKHIMRCAKSLAPRTYSYRNRGRPAKEQDYDEAIPMILRACSNCGSECKERKDVCSRWTPMEPKACPFWGHTPAIRCRNGVLSEIRCDRCNLSMSAYNVRNGDVLLIQMWNARHPHSDAE